MDVRKNLFLIFKEATNNMVKYSEATRAQFSITNENNHIVMKIRDNGKGFDTNADSAGNGIKSMKKRAADIGGIFSLESYPGRGTTIQLKVAL